MLHGDEKSRWQTFTELILNHNVKRFLSRLISVIKHHGSCRSRSRTNSHRSCRNSLYGSWPSVCVSPSVVGCLGGALALWKAIWRQAVSASGGTFLQDGGGDFTQSSSASCPPRWQLPDNRARPSTHTRLLSLAPGVCVWREGVRAGGGNLTSRSWPSPPSQRQSERLHPPTSATADQLPLALYHAGAAAQQLLLFDLLKLQGLWRFTTHQLLQTKWERSSKSQELKSPFWPNQLQKLRHVSHITKHACLWNMFFIFLQTACHSPKKSQADPSDSWTTSARGSREAHGPERGCDRLFSAPAMWCDEPGVYEKWVNR